MAERIWSKFHPLFGADLKVGFETTFPAVTVLDLLDPLYEKSGLIHYQPKESIVRICEPATKIVGSCLDNDAAQVLFKPVSSDGPLYQRLVFARKIDHQLQKARRWIVAARYPSAYYHEITTFGFDSPLNSNNQRYLPLAYPGRDPDGQFAPVYFKIQNGKEEFIYLETWVLDDLVQVLVTARRVEESKAPEHLRSAVPDEGEEAAKLVYSF
ncbi:MAG: hypothetical protein Q7J30_02685 [Candidatus Azambacteria bacterium]|nr:hypothetical protein [Candidatus Azambacteria bacterium]